MTIPAIQNLTPGTGAPARLRASVLDCEGKMVLETLPVTPLEPDQASVDVAAVSVCARAYGVAQALRSGIKTIVCAGR